MTVTDPTATATIGRACPECGTAVPADAPACPDCGLALASPSPEPARPPDDGNGTALAVRQADAVDRAAEAALALPGMAGRDEFLALAMQAKLLSMSGAAPKAIRGNPHVALHVAMIGRDLGISPSAAVELIDVIETKQGPRPSLSPQLMNGQLRRLGLGMIRAAGRSDRGCYAVALEPGGHVDYRCARIWPAHAEPGPCGCHGIVGESYFGWGEAQTAGLIDRRCPDAQHHWVKEGTRGKDRDNRCDCVFGYLTWPDRMFWWRSSGFCADDFFPEAGLGLYQPEALGAIVDAEGRAIDPATVELPDGYERAGTAGGDPDEAAAPEVTWALQRRWHALPEDAHDEYRGRWKQAKVPGAPWRFPASKAGLAESLMRGVEQQWRARGLYDPEAGPAALDANVLGPCAAAAAGMPAGWHRPDATAAAEPPGAPDAADPADGAERTAGDDLGAAETSVDEPASGRLLDPGPTDTGPTGLPPLDCPPDIAADADLATQWAIGHVKAKTLSEVDADLAARGLKTTGKADDRRARLAIAVMGQLGVPVADHWET